MGEDILQTDAVELCATTVITKIVRNQVEPLTLRRAVRGRLS